MAIVVLDTNILIWGLKRECTPGQEGMVKKAELFLKYLDDNENSVLIPSIVLGELLMNIPVEKHPKFISQIEGKFKIANYDAIAASCFARIWQDKKGDEGVKIIKKNLSVTKTHQRADYLIIAIAVTRGAKCIYSHNTSELKKFAEGYIDVKDMPLDLYEQLYLFDNKNSKINDA